MRHETGRAPRDGGGREGETQNIFMLWELLKKVCATN